MNTTCWRNDWRNKRHWDRPICPYPAVFIVFRPKHTLTGSATTPHPLLSLSSNSIREALWNNVLKRLENISLWKTSYLLLSTFTREWKVTNYKEVLGIHCATSTIVCFESQVYVSLWLQGSSLGNYSNTYMHINIHIERLSVVIA